MEDQAEDHPSESDSGSIDTPGKSPTIHLDESGDLRLRTASQDYVVCSHALARSSQFWKKAMLNKKRQESRGNTQDEWFIDLSEDKDEPMLVLLNIIHSRFELVAASPSIVELYDILVLADKYMMEAKLQPWAAHWYSNVKANTTSRHLLYISWHFGCRNMVAKLLWDLVWHAELNEKDNKLLLHIEDLDSVLPLYRGPSVLEIVKDARKEAVDTLKKNWSSVIRNMWETKSSCSRNCNAYVLRGLQQHEYQCLGSRLMTEYPGSLKRLYDAIQTSDKAVKQQFLHQYSYRDCHCSNPVPAMQDRAAADIKRLKEGIIDKNVEKVLQRKANEIGGNLE